MRIECRDFSSFHTICVLWDVGHHAELDLLPNKIKVVYYESTADVESTLLGLVKNILDWTDKRVPLGSAGRKLQLLASLLAGEDQIRWLQDEEADNDNP